MTQNVREASSLEAPSPDERFMWGDTVDYPANLALLRLGYAKGLEGSQPAAYEAGFSDGRVEGYDEGYDDGCADGRVEGYVEGFDEGYALGRDKGYNEGYNDGMAHWDRIDSAPDLSFLDDEEDAS